MKIATTSFLAAVLFIAPLFSSAQDAKPDEATRAAAKALLDAADTEKVMNESMEQAMEGQMGPLKQLGISPEGLKKLKAEMLAFVKEVMNYEEIEPALIDLYATKFTKAELDEITAFYKTPAGKKSITLAPTLMAEGMALGEAKVQARSAELQARIMPIIQSELGQ